MEEPHSSSQFAELRIPWKTIYWELPYEAGQNALAGSFFGFMIGS
ncbi:MAG TPA: hypothetical protein V6D22_11515 [Candidatus Obscuribacterales bacterium]